MDYLDKWVFNRIKKSINSDNIEDFKLYRLREILKYSFNKSPFYKELFKRININPDCVEDFKRIPFTEQMDISNDPYRFLCVSQGDVERVITFFSSGTTGHKKRVFFTKSDIEEIVDFFKALFKNFGDKGDRVLILLPSERPLGQGDLLSKGIKKGKGIPLLPLLNLEPEDYIGIIKEKNPKIIVGFPSFINRITKMAKTDLTKLGVDYIVLTSEYLSESLRDRLEEEWDTVVLSHYGLTEMGLGVGLECKFKNGFHFNESSLFTEVIDITNKKVLDYGEEGELIFTTLKREGMPFIRYRTHDISYLIKERCRCGSRLKRIGKIKKRIDSVFKMKNGLEIYTSIFDDILFSFPYIIDYRIFVDGDVIKFMVESLKKDIIIKEKIKEKTMEYFKIENSLSVDIELLEKGFFKSYNPIKRVIRCVR